MKNIRVETSLLSVSLLALALLSLAPAALADNGTTTTTDTTTTDSATPATAPDAATAPEAATPPDAATAPTGQTSSEGTQTTDTTTTDSTTPATAPDAATAPIAPTSAQTSATQQQLLSVVGGDLVRCPDFTTVYYVAKDGNRYGFPNEKTYFTWYPSFATVHTISCADLALLPLKNNVRYKAGVRLIKIESAPTVYAVEPGASLRAIESEAMAASLYGSDWAKHVDDVPSTFFEDYTVAAPLTADEIPAWMILFEDAAHSYDVVLPDGSVGILGTSVPADLDTSFIVTRTTSPDVFTTLTTALSSAKSISTEVRSAFSNVIPVPDDEVVALPTIPYLESDEGDSDKDGIRDIDEIKVYFSDPHKSDTDGDGYGDGIEVESGFSPIGSGKLAT